MSTPSGPGSSSRRTWSISERSPVQQKPSEDVQSSDAKAGSGKTRGAGGRSDSHDKVGEKPSKRIALFVAHGMGQQMPFTAIDQIGEGVARSLDLEESDVEVLPVLLQTEEGEKVYERAQVQYPKENPTIQVEIYESYWAPLTEGRVGIRDILSFLGTGAWAGIRRSSTSKAESWRFRESRPLEHKGCQLISYILLGWSSSLWF